MNCTPQALVDAAFCFSKFGKHDLDAANIYLLCQWAIQPTAAFSWEPETAQAQWTDSGGNHIGDLTAFNAAGPDDVTDLDFEATGATITALNNLYLLPNLNHIAAGAAAILVLDASNCPSLVWAELNAAVFTSIDLSNCPLLDRVDVNNNALTYLNLTGSTAVTILNCQANTGLQSIVGFAALTNLVTFTGANCGFITLDFTGFASLTTLDCNTNASLTTLTLTGCTGLVTLDCNTCGSLTAFNLTGLAALTTLDCSNCALVTLDASPCTSLVTLTCNNNLINNVSGGLVLTGLTLLQQIDCSSNALSSLDCTGLTSLVSFLAPGNTGPLTTLNFTNCTSLTNLDLSLGGGGYGTLTSVIFTGASLMDTLSCSDNSISDLRIGTSTHWVSVIAINNALPTTGVLPIEGVDEILNRLVTNCLANAGNCDLTGGTNGAPTLPCGNPASDCFALNNAGWTAITN